MIGSKTTAPDASKISVLTMLMLLVCVGMWVYRNSLDAPGVLDDGYGFHKTLELHDKEDWSYWKLKPRSVVFLTLIANYKIGGNKVRGYHQFNRLVHIVVALLLFGIVHRTLMLAPLRDKYVHSAHWLSFAVALIWLVHPLQTQAVTYMIQRMESLMALFYLFTFYCVIRGSQSDHSKAWYFLAAISFFIGIGTKEVIATAPLAIILYDRIFLSRSWAKLVLRRKYLYLSMVTPLILFAIYISPYFLSSKARVMGFGHPWITPWMYARTQSAVIIHYLRLAFWPDKLCLDYCWPVMATNELMVPLAIILSMLAISLWALYRFSKIGFLALSFFTILAPTSSFIPINDLAMEHRMYLPLAPLIILAVFLLHALLKIVARRYSWSGKRELQVFLSCLFLLAIPLSVRTVRRNEDYLTPQKLLRKDVSISPESYRASFNLGVRLWDKGAKDEAASYFSRSFLSIVKYWSRDKRMLTNHYDAVQLSVTFTHKPKSLVSILKEAIRINPSEPLLHFWLGEQYRASGEFNSAAREYEAALDCDPSHSDSRFILASIKLKYHKPFESIHHLQNIIKNDADNIPARNFLAWILAAHPDDSVRNGADAVRLAEYICFQKKAVDGKSWGTLAGAYAETGQYDKAVWASQRSIKYAQNRGDPGNPTRAREQLRFYQLKQPFRMSISKIEIRKRRDPSDVDDSHNH